MPDDIPSDEFVYRLVVDGVSLDSLLIFRGPLRVGDAFPLAEGGGRVTKIVRDGNEGSYELHVTPLI